MEGLKLLSNILINTSVQSAPCLPLREDDSARLSSHLFAARELQAAVQRVVEAIEAPELRGITLPTELTAGSIEERVSAIERRRSEQAEKLEALAQTYETLRGGHSCLSALSPVERALHAAELVHRSGTFVSEANRFLDEWSESRTILAAHEAQLLITVGCRERSELTERIEEVGRAERQLRQKFLGLGSLLFRRQLEELCETKADLHGVRKTLEHHKIPTEDQLPFSRESLTKLPTLLTSRFALTLEDTLRQERYTVRTALTQVEKREIPEEVRAALWSNQFDRCSHHITDIARRYDYLANSAENYQSLFATVRAILVQGQAYCEQSPERFRYDRETPEWLALNERIAGLPAGLHFSVEDALRNGIGTAEGQWNTIWNWLLDHPVVADQRAIDSLHHQIVETLIQHGDSFQVERDDFTAMQQVPLTANREHDGRSLDFVLAYERDTLRDVVASPAVQRYLGVDFIHRAEEVLQQEVFDRFKEGFLGSKDDRIELGRKMIVTPSLEAAPFILLYATTEPGFSGECPFRGHLNGESDLTTYLKRLREAVGGDIERVDIPGFREAVRLIENHPETYGHATVEGSRGELVSNPVNAQYESYLIDVAEALLKTGDSSSQRFALHSLKRLSAPLTDSVAATVREMLRTAADDAIRFECFEALLEHSQRSHGIQSGLLVLDILREFPEFRSELGKEGGFKLLRTLTKSELAPGDRDVLSDLIQASSEEVRRVHGLIRELRRRPDFDRHFEYRGDTLEEDFAAYAAAAALPGVHEALSELSRYGYLFRREHLPVLPSLIEQHPRIIADMERIRGYNQDFAYEPVTWAERGGWIERITIDPYAGLVMRLSAEGVVDVLSNSYQQEGDIDPFLVRAAYGAWCSRGEDSTKIYGSVEDVPRFFFASLTCIVQAAHAGPERSISPLGALIAHPMGQQLLSRSEAWATALIDVAERFSTDPNLSGIKAREALFLTLDVLHLVDRGAKEPPIDLKGWSACIARGVSGVAPTALYDQVGRPSLNSGTLKSEIVALFTDLHPLLRDTETRQAFERSFGDSAAGFGLVFEGLSELRSLARDRTSLIAVCETVRGAAERLGQRRGSVLREGLATTRMNGWLNSVEELHAVLPKLENLAAQGLASSETWKTLGALYSRQQRSTLLVAQPLIDGAAELDVFTDYIKSHGTITLPTLYGLFHRCANEQPFSAAERARYGIRATGKAGLAELRERSARVQERLLLADEPIDLSSPLDVELIATLSRFGDSEWARNDQTLEDRIEGFNAAWQKGALAPLSPAFRAHAGATMRVARLDSRAVDRFEYAEPTLMKLEQLREDILAVQGRTLGEVFEVQRSRLLEGISEEIAALSRELSDDEKVRDSSGKRAAARAERAERWVDFEARVREVNNLVGLVKVIASFEQKDNPTTTPILRRALTRLGLEQIAGGVDLVATARAPTGRETIARMVEFFGGTVRGDVLRDLELTDYQSRRAGAVVSVKALTAELARIEGLSTAGTELIGLQPTRGILAELSGFVCDACFTAEVGIAERFPQITAVVFVKNPDLPSKRLCGATLVMKARTLETDTAPAEDVFIVRGFNPLQNTITQLKADQFFENFIGWLSDVARAEGVKKIIIPGGSVGGAQTNRPSINLHVGETYARAPKVRLSAEVETRFNGYVIKNDCLLVRDLNNAERNSP